MFIHLAETGQTIELLESFHSGTKVEEVQAFLRDLTGISKENQLLLVTKSRLEPERTLSTYGLPSDDRPIFLFHKQLLLPGSPPPKPEVLEGNFDIKFPQSLPPLRSNSIFGNSPDPAIRHLPKYEQQFDYHFQKGHAIFCASEAKLEACRQLAMEIHVQGMALEAARDSMEQHHTLLEQVYGGFMTEFQRQSQQRAEILTTFEADIEKLRACTLHPALQTQDRRTLVDCIDEASLRKQVDVCAAENTQLCHEVARRNKTYIEYKRDVEAFLKDGVSMDLNRELDSAISCIEEEECILQSIGKNNAMVTQFLDGSSGDRRSVQDFVSALGPIYDHQQKSHLPKMEELDRKLGKFLEFFLKRKNEMSLRVQSRMQTVARLQKGIRDVNNVVSGFRTTMDNLGREFEALKQARRTGNSYKACLAEVVRRKAYMKLYMGQAGQLAERLARKREHEIGRREEFAQLHSLNLPGKVLAGMGLSGVPSQCVIDIQPFDTKLLDVDVDHIVQYAPRYLLGSMVGLGDGWNSEMDEYGVDEIAGTSKLEVENVRLKAQLASSIAIICSLDSKFHLGSLGDSEDQELKFYGGDSLETTMEALRLKDEHVGHLQNIIAAKQTQCNAYENRIRELENRLREQEEHKYLSLSTIPPEIDTMVTNEDQANTGQSDTMVTNEDQANTGQSDEVSGVTTSEADYRTADPMDGVSSSPPADVDNKSEAESGGDVLDESKSPSATEKINLKNDQIKHLLREVLRLAEELRQCQLNSADLEKRLHDQTQGVKCLAREGVSTGGGFAGFVQSLRDFSRRSSSAELLELSNAVADKVENLARDTERQMRKELDSKGEMIKSLATKRKQEKQTSREKVCLSRFQVHELALFLPNSAGHYEALNWNCPNYYLSDESIALFGEHYSLQQQYILGQIVHIEHHVAREASGGSDEDLRASFHPVTGRARHNPYGLPAGTHFYVLTVAMVPGLY